jgi:ribose transport system substrate-binding protein
MRIAKILTVLAVTALVGCGDRDAPQVDDGKGVEKERGKGKITIGFCMTLDHPYWQNMRLGAIDEGAKFGAEVIIMNAKEDPLLQIQQIQQLIAKQVDVACVVPMKKEPLVAGIKALNDANIPVIIVNREVAEGCDYVCYTGTDTYAGGVTSAEILMEAIGGKGGIVELHQHKGTGPQLMRSQALRDVMAKHPDITLLASVPHDGDRGKAVRETQVLLGKFPELKGIYAHGDNFAIAAADACIEAGRKDIAVVGMGGSVEAIEAIKAGKITGTSYQRPEEEGRRGVRLAVLHVTKRDLIPCPAITRENAAEFKGQF